MLPNLSHSSSQDVADHIPVMAHEVAELLELRPGDTVVDCTFGAGGHAAVLEPYLRGSGTYIAVDRDAEAEGYFDQFAADRVCSHPVSCTAISRWYCATWRPPASTPTRC